MLAEVRNAEERELAGRTLQNRNNALFVDGFGDARRHWIEIDLGRVRVVSAVATQGRGDADCWVTSFKVQYKRSNNLLLKARADGPDGFHTIKQPRDGSGGGGGRVAPEIHTDDRPAAPGGTAIPGPR